MSTLGRSMDDCHNYESLSAKELAGLLFANEIQQRVFEGLIDHIESLEDRLNVLEEYTQ